MVNLVIFDMDGLMFDTELLMIRAWQIAADKRKITLNAKIMEEMIGLPWGRCRKMFADDFGGSDIFDLLLHEGGREYDILIEAEGVPKKPGLIELLEYLKENEIKAVVATSTNQKRAHEVLKKAGVFDYFAEIVTGDMVKRGKPAPDIFLKACEVVGESPENAIVLEDSPFGAQGAHDGGIRCIFIPDLKQPDEDTKKRITLKLESLSNVIDVLPTL